MKNESHEPQSSSPCTFPISTTRHDGWTGEKMAIFCETLADSALVADACEDAGMAVSGAYALRRRNPLFAAAWDAALTVARERLADTLLARSIEGNIEQIWRDGAIIGERHVIDNRLGLAILRRLDRLAETGASVSSRGERFVILHRHPQSAPACYPRPIDWELAIDALRTGNDDAVAEALALFKGHEVEEVEDPPISLSQGDTRAGLPGAGRASDSEDDGFDLSGRCWRDEDTLGERVWMTDFPPPPGFDGYAEGQPGGFTYKRECTAEEAALLEANEAAQLAEEQSDDEALRDAWFAMLQEEADSQVDARDKPAENPDPVQDC